MVCPYLYTIARLLTRVSRTDAKPVSIVALGCFHPVMKVQSASIHFFLGSDEEKEDSDDEQEDVSVASRASSVYLTFHQAPDVRALHHRREINKKTRGGDKKLQKSLNAAKKVC